MDTNRLWNAAADRLTHATVRAVEIPQHGGSGCCFTVAFLQHSEDAAVEILRAGESEKVRCSRILQNSDDRSASAPQ
jgi:hypothetical protein